MPESEKPSKKPSKRKEAERKLSQETLGRVPLFAGLDTKVAARKSRTKTPGQKQMNSIIRALLESLHKTSSYVFPSPKTGEKFVDFKGRFDAARKKAAISNFRFHDLRHTAATRMADAGVDIFTLAAILGHSDIRMTRRYAHATDESKRRAVEKLVQSSQSRDANVTNEAGQAFELAASL